MTDTSESSSIQTLRRLVIRARVDASVPVDWPEQYTANKKAIVSVHRSARGLLQAMSLPSNSGWRLLPVPLFIEFLTAWAELIKENKKALDTLREAAGIDGEALAQSVVLSTRFEDYPTGNFDMMPDVRPAMIARLAATMDAEARKVLDGAAGYALSRLVAPLTTLRDRLTIYSQRATGANAEGRAGVFRNSTVDNVKEVASRLPAWNLLGDERVALTHSRLLGFARVEASTLRSHDAIRDAVVIRTDELLGMLKDWGVSASTDGGSDD
jgi:hypothetical protein